MQKKGSFTWLLITSLWAVVSCDLIKRYYFVDQQMTWTNAQQYCRDNYLDLAFISNQAELDTFQNIVNQYQTQQVWIGLYRVQFNNWMWSGGWNSGFIYSHDGLPYSNGNNNNNMNNDDNNCAYLWPNWLELRVDCNTQLNFVCFNRSVILVQEDLTWEEALDYCRDHYSDLISLMSDNEQRQVQYIMNANGVQTDQVWTGLRYLANQWLWVNGDPLVTLSWTGGSLSSCPEHLHCGTLAQKGALGGVSHCGERRNFLCFPNDTNAIL